MQISGLLMNVPNVGRSANSMAYYKDLVNQFKLEYMMLDSGGFQILQEEEKGKTVLHIEDKPLYFNGKLNLTPYHVGLTAGKIKPHIVIGLDYPIRKIITEREQDKEFQKKYPINVKWARETSIQCKISSPTSRYYIPIQTYTLKQCCLFYDSVKILPHEGVAMPIRNINLLSLSEFLIEFYHYGIQEVHLLGVGAFFPIALCAYAARHLFNWVSLDAQSWRIYSQHLRYLHPLNLYPLLITDASFQNTLIHLCPCNWCKYMVKNRMSFTVMSRKEISLFLNCHNFWITQHVTKQLLNHAGSKSRYIRFLNTLELKTFKTHQKKRDDLKQCFEKIDAAVG